MTPREALVGALLPGAERASPRFWARFDAEAPWHLRLGVAVSARVLVSLWPRLCGFLRPLPALSEEEREGLLARAAHTPLLRELVMLGKLVACFAAFDAEDGA